MIVDDLKKANIDALKQKDTIARNLYAVLLNKVKLAEISKREKNEQLVDTDVIAILQKSVKELTEEMANYQKVNNDVEVENIAYQLKLIEKFLPVMMTKEEIKNIILGLDDKSVPFVMKHFKTNYAGKCDMRLVSETLKEL